MCQMLRFVCLLILCVLVVPRSDHQLLGQTNVGKILGSVRDPSGAVVPSAIVSVRAVSTGVVTEGKVNGQGAYVFPFLPIGEYVVTVSATGFKKAEHSGIHVVGSEAVTSDFTLEIGEPTETVQVSAEAAKVDTTTTTSGTTIFASEIADLPLLINGGARSGLNFVDVLPGVNGGTMGTINGAPEGGIGYYLDGTLGAYSGHGKTGDSFGMPPEALAELRLNATNDSQYSGANSGVTITAVTKSGTNELHGDAYWYLRRPWLNAGCYYCNGTPDPSNQNEEGFVIGGPVLLPKIYNGRNKTFFFGTYSKYSYRTAATGTVLTVPTPLMRQGDFSEWLAFGPSRQIYDPNNVIPNPAGPGFVRAPFPDNIIPSNRISKVSQYFQSFFPLPNLPGLVNNWRGTLEPSSTDNEKFSIKIDQNFGSRNRLNGAFDRSKTQQLSPGTWTGPLATGISYKNYAYRVRTEWQAILSPNMVFSLRTAVNRTYYGHVVAPNDLAAEGGKLAGITNQQMPYTPQTSFEGGSFGIVPFAGIDGNTQTIVPVNADMSWTKGKHNIKYGFSFANNTVVSQDCFGCAGYAIFSGLSSSGLAGSVGQGYSEFLLGTPFLYIMNTSLYTKYLLNEWGWYGQDSWRITPKLTMDFGIRLDVLQPPREAHDRISLVDTSIPNVAAGGLLGARAFFGDCKACNGLHRAIATQHPISPHLGLAYQVDPKTVIRASYGFASVNLLGLFESGIQLALAGGSVGFNYTGVGFFGGVGTPTSPPKRTWDSPWPITVPKLPNYSSTISNGAIGAYWDPQGFRAGRSQNLSFGVERELPHSFVLKVGYVGNLSHGLPVANVTRGSDIDPKYASLGNVLGQDINSPAAIAAGIPKPYPTFTGTVAQALSPFPQFLGMANISENRGFSLYHSFQSTLQKRYGDLSFLLSYTISKQSSNYNSFGGLGQGYTFTGTQNDAFVSQYKVPANIDVPQVLVLSWVYQFPFGPGKRFLNSTNPFLGQVVGGWRLAAIQRYQSGGIIRVSQSNIGIPGFGPLWPVRVNSAPMQTPGVGCGNYDPRDPARNKYLNVAAFADPLPFTIGNTSVLPDVRTCGYMNEDVSLQKEIRVHERVRLEMAVDVQNLFNRHAWTGLNTNIDTVGTFGQYTGTTGPRLTQLHFKITF
jgi:carboxypeptidase family protein/TonB-dependent receptor-like protein